MNQTGITARSIERKGAEKAGESSSMARNIHVGRGREDCRNGVNADLNSDAVCTPESTETCDEIPAL
jgi:hypothetical protein